MGLHNIKNRDHENVNVCGSSHACSEGESCDMAPVWCELNHWQKMCRVIGILHGVVLWKTLIGTKVILTRVDYKTLSAIQTNHPCGILSKCRLMVMILIFLLIKLST